MGRIRYQLALISAAAKAAGKAGLMSAVAAASLGRHRQAVGMCRRMASAAGADAVLGNLPQVELESIVPGSALAGVTVIHPKSHAWNVTLTELYTLNALVRAVAPRKVFEFGTFDGRTTANLLLNAPADCRITTLDLPMELSGLSRETIGRHFAGVSGGERVAQLLVESDRLEVDKLAGNFDFVFVDADHSYAGVRNDSGRAMRLIGGDRALIVWHDYGTHIPVTAAVDDFARERGDGDRFAWIRGTSLAIYAEQGFRSGTLRPCRRDLDPRGERVSVDSVAEMPVARSTARAAC